MHNATLEFANTYYLAFRDLPGILATHVTGTRALDFGCGTGRSTRFLRSLGFNVTGIDISEDMLRIARATDPLGDYRLVPGDAFTQLAPASFDLVLCAFPFDNITGGKKARVLCGLAKLLAGSGIMVNLVSSPEIYTHEWASFTSRDFPENAFARSGDAVRIIVTDHEDRRPVEDILCGDEEYRALYRQAHLEPIEVHAPLAQGNEPYSWVSEPQIAPWVIYVFEECRVVGVTPDCSPGALNGFVNIVGNHYAHDSGFVAVPL